MPMNKPTTDEPTTDEPTGMSEPDFIEIDDVSWRTGIYSREQLRRFLRTAIASFEEQFQFGVQVSDRHKKNYVLGYFLSAMGLSDESV